MINDTDQKKKAALNRTAISATIHCLTGCAIGEVTGMVIGTSMGLGNWTTIGISVVLAFIFGYSLTLLPLVRAGIAMGSALKLAFASDTISIAIMEIIDNLIMLVIPGAMAAGPATLLFWGSMILSLGIAALAAFPVVRWLITRGRGHAVVQKYHDHHSGPAVVKETTAENPEKVASGHMHHH